MAIDEHDSFGVYKRKTAKLAEDMYGYDVAQRIREAKDEVEIIRILSTERHRL